MTATTYNVPEIVQQVKGAIPALARKYSDSQLAEKVNKVIADRQAAKELPHVLALTRAVIDLARLDIMHN